MMVGCCWNHLIRVGVVGWEEKSSYVNIFIGLTNTIGNGCGGEYAEWGAVGVERGSIDQD